MRYIEDEIAGDGDKRLVFALGKQEAIIIYSLLQKARIYMPKTPETRYDHARINNMCQELHPLVKKLSRLDYTENEMVPIDPSGMVL